MAIFDGKFIKGTAGAVVYKKYRSLQVVQGKSKKKKIKRTVATKKAAVGFGIASNLACTFRDDLSAIISGFYDGTMIYRLNTEVLYSLRRGMNMETGNYRFTEQSFDRLNGFEFNIGSLVKHHFFAQPEIHIDGNQLAVRMPEMNIPRDLKFPKEARGCRLNISLTTYDLTYGHSAKASIKTIEFLYNQVRPVVIAPKQINFEIQAGCLCMVAISLQYIEKTFSGDFLLNNKLFNPSAIIKAIFADGDVDLEHTKKWQKIKFGIV